MARIGERWRTILSGFTRLLPSRRRRSDARGQEPRILAIVPQGPNRLLLQAISNNAGWALTLADAPASSASQVDVPPIVIYDRELSPFHWRDAVGVLTKGSPRPYVILLSPTTDKNLWDELQRLGGSDILRTPVDRDNLRWAIKRAWLLWRSQQQARS